MSAKPRNSRKSLDEIASILSEVEFDDSTRKRLLKVHSWLSEELEDRWFFDWGPFFMKLYSPVGLIAGVITISTAIWAIISF